MVPFFSSTCCELHFLHFWLSMDVDQSASLPTFLEMVTRYQSIQSLRPTNVGLPVLLTLVVRYPFMLQDTDLEKRWNKSKTYILDSYLFRGLIRSDNAWYWRWLNFKEPSVLKSASLHHFPEKTQSQMVGCFVGSKRRKTDPKSHGGSTVATYEKVDREGLQPENLFFFFRNFAFTTFEYYMCWCYIYFFFLGKICISKKV